MSETTLQRVTEIVAEHLGIPASDIKPESTFVDDLGADSLDTIEIVMFLEDAFRLEIYDDEAERLLTVGQAAALIDAKRAA